MTEIDADTPYENTLSLDQLRRELRQELDLKFALIKALREIPEVPPYDVLIFLSTAAKWPSDWEKGKEIQRSHPDKIAFKTECEQGAGLWHRIREGLLASAEPTSEKGNAITASPRTHDHPHQKH